MRSPEPYRKYIYWLQPATCREVLHEIEGQGKRLYRAKRHPCEVLYPRREMAVVQPEAWDLQCRRQGSWYRASKRKGWSLLVTSHPWDRLSPWGTLTLADFKPPRLATDQDVLALLEDRRALEVLPEGWGLFSPWELQAIQGYLASQGIRRSIQEVFCYYTSNHLNFLFPRFFVSDAGHPVIPYSIQGTPLVCSACVEIFGILGEDYPVKYLVPCPGLKYVNVPRGQYLRVTNETPSPGPGP